MKILLVTHYYSPEYGAPQRRWNQLVHDFRTAGHSVVVVCPPPHYPHGRIDPEYRKRYAPGTAGWGEHGEYIIRTAYLPHREDIVTRTLDHAVAALDAARRILLTLGTRNFQPDIVISTAPGIPSLLVGRVVSTIFAVPCIAEMRDAWPDLVTHMSVGKAEHIRAESIERDSSDRLCTTGMNRASRALKTMVHRGITHYQRLATQVVTTTEGFARVLEERGIAHPVVIRNGANLAGITEAPHIEPSGEPLRVLYFGNKGRAQGLRTLVEAAALAYKRGVDLHVKIIGHGIEHNRLSALAHELQAPVEVLERVGHESASRYYAWADTVVVSLRPWEPFDWTVPSKTYEILATGRHITACVRGETARIVARSGAGDVLPPGDVEALAEHFCRLSSYPELLQRRGRGRAWLAEKASTDVLARNYMRLIDELVMHSCERTIPMTATHAVQRCARNAYVTGTVARRHLHDDPALFAVQLVRRAPVPARRLTGTVLRAVGARVPGARGVNALGSFMAGEHEDAARAIDAAPRSRVAAEVGVLLDRTTPGEESSAAIRARSLWNAGALSDALHELEASTHSADRALYSRLASEKRLLTPGVTLIDDDLRAEATRILEAHPSTAPRSLPRPFDTPERVLHVLTNSLPHTQSGYTLRSHAIMRAQHESGMAVRAITRVGYPLLVGKMMTNDAETVDGVTYCRVLPWVLGSTIEERLRQQVLALLEHVATFKPTVLHTTTNYTNALVTHAVSELTGIPWVYEVRGLMEQTWAASKKNPVAHERALASEKYRLTRAREAELANYADGLVVIAETMKLELAERGVDPARMHTVPNSVDSELFALRRQPREARSQLNLEADGFWVGAASSLVDYEGFETLIDAVALTRQDGRDVRLMLVGDGVARPRLEKHAQRAGIAEYCLFTGTVPKEHAATHILALDAVVIPRHDTPVTRHVTPLKPVEAMALGRPVIVSDIPALRELLVPVGAAQLVCTAYAAEETHGVEAAHSDPYPRSTPHRRAVWREQAGLTVRPGEPASIADAIGKLMDDPELKETLLAAGDACARERTWETVTNTYTSVYAEARARAEARA